MRILGLDYGSKTVGVAVSDDLMLTAQGVEVVRREKDSAIRPTMRRIKEIIDEYQVQEIILGYPKTMDNLVGERAEKTEAFKKKLENSTKLPVILWDERYSTVAATKLLIEGNYNRQERTKMVDKIAAIYILQGYLDAYQMNKQ